ncbi:hypothetical protein SDC9_122989 [bioreactor metagenome]|uniref:Uncharacterized protein n=1 Tax=bioreactor metagenome TaxID=1076179 RepID=A0A645CGD6_9ZZZZ
MVKPIKLILCGARPKQAAVPFLEVVVGGLAADFPKVAAHRPHVGVDGHAVVVQNHDQRLSGGPGVVQSLIGQTSGQRSVSDQSQHIVILLFQRPGPGHAQRHGDGIGCVARHKRVVSALIGLWKSGKAAELPQSAEQLPAACQSLVDIALVAHVEHQPVIGGIEHPVDRHRQLHHTQIGGQMPAGF